MQHVLNLDNIPLGKLFFLRLENAFLLADTGDTIEILSRFDNLESELVSWCRLKAETFLHKTALKGCFAYLLRKDSAQDFMAFAPELALAPHGVAAQQASPDYHFAPNHKDELWSKNVDKRQFALDITEFHSPDACGRGRGDEIRAAGLNVVRHNSDLGKHGDTGRSEFDVLDSIKRGELDAGAVGSSTWIRILQAAMKEQNLLANA